MFNTPERRLVTSLPMKRQAAHRQRMPKSSFTTQSASNWLVLRKVQERADGPRKRRKIDHHTASNNAAAEPPSFPRGNGSRNAAEDEGVEFKSDEIRNGESIAQLRKMVMGKLEFSKTQQQYVALAVYHQMTLISLWYPDLENIFRLTVRWLEWV